MGVKELCSYLTPGSHSPVYGDKSANSKHKELSGVLKNQDKLKLNSFYA